MVSKEEVPRTIYNPKYDTYYMHYKNVHKEKFEWEEFTSDTTVVTKDELQVILKNYNYFKP